MALDTDDIKTLAQTMAALFAPLMTEMQKQNAALMQTMQQSQADMLATLISSQKDSNTILAAEARKNKRPESYLNDFPEPLQNWFTPDGEPLPKLVCESFLGYWEEDEGSGAMIIHAGFPFVAEERGGCTREERVLINSLEAGVYRCKTRDGSEGVVRVQVRHDTDGSPVRLTVAVPKQWLSREKKNLLGGVELLKQLQPEVAKSAAA